MSDALQDKLRALFAKAKMPTSPVLAASILELAEDPDSTVDEFADLIQTDVALATRLLRMANSATYAPRHQVTTIQRAVSLLGINRVRTTSLGFQLVSHLDRLGGCPFDVQRFWQHSLLRGCIAREFAEAVIPESSDEAFLIGLLQDSGILLLVQILGEPYARLCRAEDLCPSSMFTAESRSHPYTHPQVTAAMAREWKLPEVIITHVENHHTEPPLATSPVAQDYLRPISYLAGSIQLTSASSVSETDAGLGQFAKLHLGMDNEAVTICLKRAGKAYTELGNLLQGSVPDDMDVTDLLSRANEHLTKSMESERERSAQEREHLSTALGDYRERAARDPLTGILNRGALNDAISESIQQAKSRGEFTTLLFLDLDNFKRLNDTCGHQAGDDVLKGIAQTLKESTPNGGIVGRYGGEEFVIFVTRLDESGARRFADDVLASVRATQFPGLDLPGPVTCSLGAVWVTPDEVTTANALLSAADELMYKAKRSGKDRCCFGRPNEAYNINLLQSDSATIEACADALCGTGTHRRDTTPVPEVFQQIAKRLNGNTPKRFLDMRKHVRKDLVTPCTLTALKAGSLEFASQCAYARNISTGGVGILTSGSLRRGQPAEVAVLIGGGRPTLYVAGIVAFCRHIEGCVYDVGLQLFTHSKQPILSEDPITAIRNLDWVARALKETRSTLASPV